MNLELAITIIAGIFSLITAVIAFMGLRQTTKLQIESSKEVAKMQNNEKIYIENRVHWDDESRELIAKFIGQAFSLNQTMEKAGLVKSRLDLANDPKLPTKERIKLLRLTEDDKNDLKVGMDGIKDIVETVAQIRLHLFEDTPNEQRVWKKIMDIEQHYTSYGSASGEDLNELTEYARIYFMGNWGRAMMANDN